MFRIGDIFESSALGVARRCLGIAGMVSAVVFGLDALGLLDLTELFESMPVMAVGGTILGSVWLGSVLAGWLTHELGESEDKARQTDITLAPDTPDLSISDPSPEPGRTFRDRVTAELSANDNRQSRAR
jgi:hypothetical protein